MKYRKLLAIIGSALTAFACNGGGGSGAGGGGALGDLINQILHPPCVTANTTVTFVDKQGNPYRNVPLVAVEDTSYEQGANPIPPSVRPKNMSFVSTDINGKLTITNAKCTIYGFRHDDNFSGYTPSFMSYAAYTGSSALIYGGSFTRITGNTNYTVTINRVLFEDGNTATLSGTSVGTFWGTVSPTQNTSNLSFFEGTSHYVAQALTPAANLSVCGVGLGLYGPVPDSIRIHDDSAGTPGALLRQVTPTFAGLSNGEFHTSSKAIGTFADLCGDPEGIGQRGDHAHAMTFQAGHTYWIVAYYATIPSGIFVSYSTRAALNGIEPIESADGSHWQNATFGWYYMSNTNQLYGSIHSHAINAGIIAQYQMGSFVPTDRMTLDVYLME